MNIPVHMFAFADEGDRSKVRIVEIPEDEYVSAGGDLDSILELTFRYGQNDFQPKRYPSVSVGDVAEVNGKYYMVQGIGWKELTKEEFDSLVPPTAWSAYARDIKESLKDTKEE